MTRVSFNPLKTLLKSTAVAAVSVGLMAGGIGIAHAAYTPPANLCRSTTWRAMTS